MNFKSLNIRLLTSVIFLSISAYFFLLFKDISSPVSNYLLTTEENPDVLLFNVVLKDFSPTGRLNYFLEATKLTHNIKTQHTKIHDINFHYHEGINEINIQAINGILYVDKSLLKLTNNILVNCKHQKDLTTTHFRTTSINVYYNNKTISTNSTIKIVNDITEVIADSLVFDYQKNIIYLKSKVVANYKK